MTALINHKTRHVKSGENREREDSALIRDQKGIAAVFSSVSDNMKLEKSRIFPAIDHWALPASPSSAGLIRPKSSDDIKKITYVLFSLNGTFGYGS